jgi:hypothetical protein
MIFFQHQRPKTLFFVDKNYQEDCAHRLRILYFEKKTQTFLFFFSWPRQWWCVVSFKNKDAAEKAVRKSEHKIKNEITYCRFQGEVN